MQIVQYIDRTPIDYEKLTITDAVVVRLTEALRGNANAVYITFEDGNIRYRIDSGDPEVVGVEGHPVYNGTSLYFTNPQAIRQLRMIALTDDVTAIVTYYK